MRRNQRRPVASANGDFHLRALMYLEGEGTVESLAELKNDLANPRNAEAFVALCQIRSELMEELPLRRRSKTSH